VASTPAAPATAARGVEPASVEPWHSGSATERAARLGRMQGVAACHLRSDHELIAALRRAETDPGAGRQALALLDALGTVPRRHILATYMRITWPRSPRARLGSRVRFVAEPVGKFRDPPPGADTGGAS
jgi:hypothetical protein